MRPENTNRTQFQALLPSLARSLPFVCVCAKPPFAAVPQKEVTSSEEVLDLLRQGNANRRTEATGANQVSSRSHAVLQVVTTRTLENCLSGSKSARESKLSLVDLAG